MHLTKRILAVSLCLIMVLSLFSTAVFAEEETKITNIEISGVVEPVAGNYCVNTASIPSDANYQLLTDRTGWLWDHNYGGSYSYWLNDNFKSGKTYMFEAEIRAFDGYYVDSTTTATINGKPAETQVWFDGQQMEIFVYYTLPGESYTISYDANGGTGTMDSQSILENNYYTLPECSFTAPTGKEFKAWSIGGYALYPGDCFEILGNITVNAIWVQSDGAIDTINITVDAPIIGKSASECLYTPTLISSPKDALTFNASESGWFVPGVYGSFVDTFEADTEYLYEICLQANDGFFFKDNYDGEDYKGKVLANGVEAEYIETSIDGSYAYIGIRMLSLSPLQNEMKKAAEELTALAGKNPSDEMKSILAAAIQRVNEATTTEEITEAKNIGLDEIKAQLEKEPAITVGDANDDGKVDMKDVLAIRKKLAGMDVVCNTINADVNGDEKMDMKDVLTIRKFLAAIIDKLS